MSRHSVPSLVIVACFVLSTAAPGNAQLLELTVEPTTGTLDQTFTIRIANRGTEEFHYDDCCAFPRITALASGQTLPVCIECEPCPPEPVLRGVLRAGASLEHRWRSEDATCVADWTPPPGIYEVRWTGFPEHVTGRFELLPDPARTLELRADPPEGRIGVPIQILAKNTAASDLCLEAGQQILSVLDPRGFDALCTAGPLCGPARCCSTIPPGDSHTFNWTPGEHLCQPESIPGRHRLIWTGLDQELKRHFGEITILVLPARDRRLELVLSANEVPLGGLLTITATNPLAVSLWYDGCCDEPIFIDEMGRQSPCSPCVQGCSGGRGNEILPGESVSIATRVPGSADCGLVPGTWSVIWGWNFGLTPGSEPTLPVFGYSEVRVLPPVEPDFLRGDCNGDGHVEGRTTDAVFLLRYSFLGTEAPPCLAACDANGDGRVGGQVTDAVYVLRHNFLGGPAPVPPFPDCGVGTQKDAALGCATAPAACKE